MVKYGNTKIPTIHIPKGTLLFRAVLNPETDFEGVNGCIPPHYNVFFYFSPFVVDGITKWHSDKQEMNIYIATHDLKVVSLIEPSKFTRITRLKKRQFMVPCNKTRKSCLVPRVYDPCFRDTFLVKNPSLLGWVSVSYDDVRMYREAVAEGLLGKRADYVVSVKDARGTTGPPELSIYPLKKRHMTEIGPQNDRELYNYAHLGALPRSGTVLEEFMDKHAEKVTGKWYYKYKE